MGQAGSDECAVGERAIYILIHSCQVDFAVGNQQLAEQQAAELQQSLESVKAKLVAADEELGSKGARLLDLEG